MDDRPLFLEYLRSTINWEGYGFEIVAEAKNGIEALEKINDYLPDVLITDINMPKMNGLDLSEKAKEKYPNMDIVLITGKSEFEMARRALKIGVSDYILKPFEKEELILTLLRLKGNITRSIEIKTNRDSEREIFFESFFRGIIYNDNLEEEYLKTKLEVFDVKIKKEEFVVVVIDLLEESNNGDSAIWNQTAIEMINQMIEIEAYNVAFLDYEGKIISIVEVNENVDIDELNDDYMKLHNLFKKHIGIDIVIGFGNVCHGFEGIRKSYKEARSALNFRFDPKFDKSKPFIRFDEISNENKEYAFYSAQMNEEILKSLRNNNREEAIKLVNSILDEIYSRNLSREYSSIIFMGILSLVLSYITQSGNTVNEVLEDEIDKIVGMSNRRSRREQRDLIIEIISKTTDYFEKHKVSRSYRITKDGKKYIKEHFSENSLTVSSVASSLYINETYLRTMFKKETGMTVIEYISKVRIKKAKDLILENTYKLSDIAEMVGYYDAAYLSKTFKKYYGISPSKYKNLEK